MTDAIPTADELRAAFETPRPFSVGLEEEAMLLDPASHDLVPRASEVLTRTADDARFKLELPASQLEIVIAPHGSVGAAVSELAAARATLARAAEGIARPALAGVHPFAAPEGELNGGERYERTAAEYGPIARRQLVCALQVHVAVGGAERSLAVYNALRSYLPVVAALAANAPFYAGCDTGLASVRPKIAELLPRQGVPPVLESWEAYADALRWGATSGVFGEPRLWWWELRPHPAFGTLELRVPDAQTTIEDAAAIAALAQTLVAWLAGRHDAGEPLGAAPTWRIESNRWSAARRGVEGELADLGTGQPQPTRSWLHALLDALAPTARQLGCTVALESARRLVERNGAMRQRDVAAEHGIRAVAEWLSERYLDGIEQGG